MHLYLTLLVRVFTRRMILFFITERLVQGVFLLQLKSLLAI